MLYRQKFKLLLDEKKTDTYTGGWRLSVRLYVKLKKLIKTIRKNSISRNMKDSESIALWIRENFARVEEGVRSNVRTLRRLKRIESCGGVPRIFAVFGRYFEENSLTESEGFCELLKILNVDGRIDLNNAFSVLPLVRAALFDRIMTLFLCAYDEKIREENVLLKIEEMFETLDNLSTVSGS